MMIGLRLRAARLQCLDDNDRSCADTLAGFDCTTQRCDLAANDAAAQSGLRCPTC